MGSSRQKTYKLFFGILSLLIFTYGFVKLLPLIKGPEITVEGLRNGENHGPVAFISGKTSGAKELRINNNEILLDEKGNFSDTLLLSAGYNIIYLSAKDSLGREKIEKFEITATDFNFPDNPSVSEIESEKDSSKEENVDAEVAGENITETDTELVSENRKLLN